MAKSRRTLRKIISITFIVFMCMTYSTIGVIIFSSWKTAATKHMNKIINHDSEDIFNMVETLINEPLKVNKVISWLFADEIVDIYDRNERERFFVDELKSRNAEIYSCSYGTENGEYYGARRNEHDEIEIMRNNAQTGHHSWYFAVTKDLTAGKMVHDFGAFDPRVRDWYQAAKLKRKPTFSPIYKHFVKNDLAISAAHPIYNKKGILQGVLGTHIVLFGINRYLQEIALTSKTVYIIEKKSGELVANSSGKPNFKTVGDKQIKRITLEQTGDQYVTKAYRDYLKTANHFFSIKTANDRLYFNIAEFRKSGLDWLILTATPESQFAHGIDESIKISIVLSLFALFIAIAVYLKGTAIILQPIYDLIRTTEKFSKGDFSQRVKHLTNDEVGDLSRAFNSMADELYAHINNLEDKIEVRTEELERTNIFLRRSQDNIRLLLDSTAEAIIGMDTEGKCTFCNSSCIKILGYQGQEELIGKAMHPLVHHHQQDGKPISKEECTIIQAFTKAEGAHATNEVFWRADGTFFPVEYYSYPQFRNGKIVGYVVTFFDIAERKKSEEAILYLSYRDQLTGLYNRRYFEDELKRLDILENYPLTIIFMDMNGLKLINDSFGHSMGDQLLKKVAEIFTGGCRSGDVIARLGGDEFVILLPRTEATEAQQVIRRIKNIAASEKINSIDISFSSGYATKYRPDQNIDDVLNKAEDYMYKNKLFESPSIRGKMINAIIGALHEKNKNEEAHSNNVSDLCKKMGEALGFLEQDIDELQNAGVLHDIGKVAIDERILLKPGELTDVEWKEVKRHSEVGYRILSTVNNMSEMAEYVLAHHERWDGKGYPKGLKGEEIPLQARIIAIADAYDAMMSKRSYRETLTPLAALRELKNNAGTQFDPKLVKVFIEKVLKR